MADASKQGLSCHPMSAPIGYGCSGLGNLYEVVPDAVADATLAEAWQAGYRYFDTSPFYGFGLSELRVGRFLRSVPRRDFILSTKVGRYMTPLRGAPHDKLHWAGPLALRPVFDYSYDGIMRSIEQSIVRLGFEQIDILLIHDVDRWTHGEAFPRMFAQAMEGAYRALDELRRQGHVKAIGVGVNEADVGLGFPPRRRLRLRHAGRPLHASRPKRARRVPAARAIARGRRVHGRRLQLGRARQTQHERISLTTTRPRRTRSWRARGALPRSATNSTCRCRPRRFNSRAATRR